MTERQRVACLLLGIGVGLGVRADVLFEGRPLGVNGGLFALAFVVAWRCFYALVASPSIRAAG